MAENDLLTEPTPDLALRLETMTDDEIFAAMATLETASEGYDDHDGEEVLSRIALVEEEIEKRFPGQVLAPYRNWKKSQAAL